MKRFQGNQNKKKPGLKKQTISNLIPGELKKIRGGVCNPCWENLWTLYHCDVIYTGESEQPE